MSARRLGVAFASCALFCAFATSCILGPKQDDPASSGEVPGPGCCGDDLGADTGGGKTSNDAAPGSDAGGGADTSTFRDAATDAVPPPSDGGTDAPAGDTSPVDGTVADSASDGSSDVAPDASTDASPDVSPDAPSDADAGEGASDVLDDASDTTPDVADVVTSG